MQDKANSLNRDVPVMVDDYTRFDYASVVSANEFKYHYTLLQQSAVSIDTIAFKTEMKTKIIASLNKNTAMDYFRKHKVTLQYQYRDNDNVPIAIIEISPGEY